MQPTHNLTTLRLQVVKLTSFAPFKNAAHALDEVNAISEAVVTDDLKNFLEVNLPKVGPLLCSRLLSIAPSLEFITCHLFFLLCVLPVAAAEGELAFTSPVHH